MGEGRGGGGGGRKLMQLCWSRGWGIRLKKAGLVVIVGVLGSYAVVRGGRGSQLKKAGVVVVVADVGKLHLIIIIFLGTSN